MSNRSGRRCHTLCMVLLSSLVLVTGSVHANQPPFHIELTFGNLSAADRQPVEAAKSFWESQITGYQWLKGPPD